MATANLSSKLTLDLSDFKTALRGATSAAKTTARGLGSVFSGVTGSVTAISTGFSAVVDGIRLAQDVAEGFGRVVANVAGRVNSAFQLGSTLSDLSEQTGIAVDQIQVFQQALRDAGGTGDNFAQIVQKQQKAVEEFGFELSTQVRAFELLGLSFEELDRLDPTSQFETIVNALGELTSQTEKAFVANQLFGRGGRDILTILGDPQALTRASITLGLQSQVLRENAAEFDRTADLINSAGTKLQGLFVGIGAEIEEPVRQGLEVFNEVDLTRFGQLIGNAIDAGLEVVGDRVAEIIGEENLRELPQIIQTALSPEGVGLFGDALLAAGNAFGVQFQNSIEEAIETVNRWLRGITGGLDLDFLRDLPGNILSGLEGFGESLFDAFERTIESRPGGNGVVELDQASQQGFFQNLLDALEDNRTLDQSLPSPSQEEIVSTLKDLQGSLIRDNRLGDAVAEFQNSVTALRELPGQLQRSSEVAAIAAAGALGGVSGFPVNFASLIDFADTVGSTILQASDNQVTRLDEQNKLLEKVVENTSQQPTPFILD